MPCQTNVTNPTEFPYSWQQGFIFPSFCESSEMLSPAFSTDGKING